MPNKPNPNIKTGTPTRSAKGVANMSNRELTASKEAKYGKKKPKPKNL